jgi:hypothetical protein
MATSDYPINQREGTSRRNRRLLALDSNYAGLDERGMMDLMVFIEEFARHIRFINKENKTAGNWSHFYSNNLAFVLARMGTFPIEKLRSGYKSQASVFEHSFDVRERREAMAKILRMTLSLFTSVDHWYTASRQDLINLQENPVAGQLSSAIRFRLRPELLRFSEVSGALKLPDWSAEHIAETLKDFNYIWEISSEMAKAKTERTADDDLRGISGEISAIFRAVVDTITFLKSQAGQWLNQVLEKYPFHSPDSALLMAFLRLYGHVQFDFNKITKRHLNYYYGVILGQHQRHALPDRVHVSLVPADHVLKTFIPKGTLLAAGTDEDGREYTYSTEFDVEISQVLIKDLRVIHVARNPAIGISGKYQAVSNIYAQQIALDPTGIALDMTDNPGPFDALGRDQSAIGPDHRAMNQAEVGFAIASPILLLKEGDRNIRLKYQFSLQSLTALVSFIEEISVSEGISAEHAFHKVLHKVFRVRLTSVDGWFTTSNYQISPPDEWASGCFFIDILLDISDPAVIAHDPETHGGDYVTRWPVLELVLDSHESMYAYSYLKDLVVTSCTIQINVTHVKDLHLFNDLGKLDINKPFFPFGSTPGLGSYFLIGNEELVRKNLTDLSLNIQWHNLPRTEGGLGAHYSAYGSELTTSSFRAGITALTDFRFLPAREENVQVFELFKEDGALKLLQDKCTLNSIALDKFKLKPNYGSIDLNEYNGQTKSGFLKIQMVSPAMGFGFSDYPRLFSQAIIENSKAGSGLLNFSGKTVDMPREPYAPQIRSISLSYSATTTLAFDPSAVASNDRTSEDQVYHLHPFGKLVVFQDGLPAVDHLLPQFNEEGYLLIGLTGVHAPVQLSFFLELTSGTISPQADIEIPETVWKYLVGDEWRFFEQEALLSDTTNHLTTSGIIILDLPAGIDTNHHILPKGFYWIAVQAAGNTDVLSRVRFLRTNGVSAVWKAHKPGAQWSKLIPAGQINSLLNSRSDVNGVIQPFPSFGGRVQEIEEDYYTRVSERLMHKNRIVQAEDYEKLVLEKFPDVFQVKCITHYSYPAFVKPGTVRLVVVPHVKNSEAFTQPRLDYNTLEAIRDYVVQLASPFVAIKVVNPNYERVRIRCRIRFESAQNTGQYVRRLESDIRRFLCPWFSSPQQEMVFGGFIEKEDLLSFIYSLDYVRFVSRFSVVVIQNQDGKYSLSDSADDLPGQMTIGSSNPWSVLIPDEGHEVELVDHSIHQAPELTRIEAMRIEGSFVIMDSPEEQISIPPIDSNKDSFFIVDIDI